MLKTLSPSGNVTRSGLLRSIPRTFFIATVVLNVVYWASELAIDLRYTGPFYYFGVDWSRFWGASRAFVTAGPRAAYQLAAIAQAMRPFASYYGSGSDFGLVMHGLRVGPSPYPPIFLFVFSLFTLPPVAVGFALWTILNVALALWVLWQLTSGLAPGARWLLVTLLILSYPLVIDFYVGQLMIVLLFAFYMAYRDFTRGLEFRAGMWLAVLLLKPQYAPVLVLVLLAKRCWHALAGMTAGGLMVLLSSLAVGGLGGIIGYVRMILVDYPNYSGGMAIDPHSLITWRGLVFDFLPSLGSTGGLALTAVLSIVSLAALVPVWSDEWAPQGTHFHAQMLATMIVTQLVAYHSHAHGAILLFVPAVYLFAEGRASRPLRWLMAAALAGPPLAAGLSVLFFRDLRLISVLYVLVMTAGLVLIMLGQPELPQRQRAAEHA